MIVQPEEHTLVHLNPDDEDKQILTELSGFNTTSPATVQVSIIIKIHLKYKYSNKFHSPCAVPCIMKVATSPKISILAIAEHASNLQLNRWILLNHKYHPPPNQHWLINVLATYSLHSHLYINNDLTVKPDDRNFRIAIQIQLKLLVMVWW